METIITSVISALIVGFLNWIATKVYNYWTGSSKNYFWKERQEETLKKMKVRLEFEELKKRTRIVVIDDEEGFPVKLFQSEGYSIDKWDSVENYGKLESGFYNIIVLDIKGVAQHISTEDGLGVLESIKKRNPAQIIIAYSQHSYDLSKSKFWELADEKIAKPSDFLKIKSIIDNLICTKFKPDRYIKALEIALTTNNIPEKEIEKIERQISSSYKAKRYP